MILNPILSSSFNLVSRIESCSVIVREEHLWVETRVFEGERYGKDMFSAGSLVTGRML